MNFENRFPESGSGQILHPVRAGQNILDLIRRPRIATILLCVDHAAAVTVQTSNHDTLSRKLRESEKGSDGLYRFEYESYTQDGSACTGILPRSHWTAMRSFTSCTESP